MFFLVPASTVGGKWLHARKDTACLPVMAVGRTLDLDCEKVYTVSLKLMSSFGITEQLR